mgnify:CR=1 FL=1
MIDKLGLVQQALTGLQRAQKASPSTDAGRAPEGPSQEEPSLSNFSEAVRTPLARISQDDPQRRKRALRAVVELALLREFGAGLEQDPSFHNTVDQVIAVLDESADTRNLVDAALDPLLSGPR